jgi:L-threonylcarbamoyladenylate synthase
MLLDSPSPSDRSFETGADHLLPSYRSHDGNDDRTVILKSASPRAIEWAAERLASGGVIALPTDTVYGIAASLAHSSALDRIFAIKNRPADLPLPILVSSIYSFLHLIFPEDQFILPLLDEFWPGALTIVLPAGCTMPSQVLGPGNTIGIRLPNHPLAIEVIEKAGGAVACTSANRTGEPSAQTAEEVANSLGPEVDLILDGGRAPGGVESTIVAIEDRALRFVREGAVAIEDVVRVWDQILTAT